MNRNRWIILGCVVGVLAIAAFAIFRPDKLFVDDTVDEDLDDDVVAAIAAGSGSPDPDESTTSTTTAAPGEEPQPTEAPTTTATTTTLPEVLGEGAFVAQGGYSVDGSAFVVDQPNGRLLVLPELNSDNGPDLQLYLSPDSSGSVDGGVKIGPLKGNIGTQSYELADDIDLAALPNVVIWCERFSVSFGTATLS